MSANWMIVALALCALVFAAAVYLELGDASVAVRAMVLAAMAAVTGLMLWVVIGDRGGGE